MILISVKSGLMDVKRQYETDKEAEKYLKGIEKQHRDYREMLARRYQYSLPTTMGNFEKVDKRRSFIKTCLPLKVEVINTDHAQLNFSTALI